MITTKLITLFESGYNKCTHLCDLETCNRNNMVVLYNMASLLRTNIQINFHHIIKMQQIATANYDIFIENCTTNSDIFVEIPNLS